MNEPGDHDSFVDLSGEGWIQSFRVLGVIIVGVASIRIWVAFSTGDGPLVLMGGAWVFVGFIFIALASIFKGIFQRQELGLKQQARILSDLGKVKASRSGGEEDDRARDTPESAKILCPACRFEMDDPPEGQTECPRCGILLDR